MSTRRVAIACQGGGLHGTFTWGFLEEVLSRLNAEAEGAAPAGGRRFEICGLSGTSAGALNAFAVWYGLILNRGRSSRFAAASATLERLWTMFRAQTPAEKAFNILALQSLRAQGLGLSVKPPVPPVFHDTLVAVLNGYANVESLFMRGTDFAEIRPEFYRFDALLDAVAPGFPGLQLRLPELAQERVEPRLLLGAVDVLSGTFEAFDSLDEVADGKGPESLRTITREAVQASGTLPEVRRAQHIPGLKNRFGDEPVYWDGLFSQNPPVREFLTRAASLAEKPNEIWVIRINPRRRRKEPEFLSEIEDRRNELAGNLSLGQELDFIQQVNQWIGKYKGLSADLQTVDIYVVGMDADVAGSLDVASKFDRDPAFTERLRSHGRARAAAFLDVWMADSAQLPQWPDDALPS